MRVLFWLFGLFLFLECQASGVLPSVDMEVQEKNDGVGKPFVQTGGSGVKSLAITANKKYIVKAGFGVELRLFDIHSQKEIRTFKGHKKRISSVLITPDGKYIISGSLDKTIRVWNIKNGKNIKTLYGHKGGVNSICLFSNGKYLLSASKDKTINMWSIKNGKKIKTFSGHFASVNSISITPDEKYFLSASDDERIALWDIKKDKPIGVLHGHSHRVTSISISKDGKYFVSGGLDKKIHLWDFLTGKILKTFKNHKNINTVLISDSSKYIISSGERGVKIWDIVNNKLIETIDKNTLNPYVFKFNKNSILIGDSYKLISYNIKTKIKKDLLRSLSQTHVVKHIFFRNNYKDIISHINNFQFWNLKNGKRKQQYVPITANEGVAISEDRKYLVVADNRLIRLFSVDKNKVIKKFHGHLDHIRDIQISDNGQYIASASQDKIIKIWDIKSGKELRSLKRHSSSPKNDIAISNKYIVSGGDVLEIWDIASGKLVKSVKGLYRQILISKNNKNIFVINTSRNTVDSIPLEGNKTSKILEKYEGSINVLKFSFDKKYLLLGNHTGSIQVLDLKSKKVIKNFYTGNTSVSDFFITNDNKYLVSAGYDGTLHLFDIRNKKEKKLVSMTSFKDGEWISITPDGYFDASKNGAKHLNILTDPLTVTSIDAYYEKFYRPDIVKLAMQGKTVDGLRKISDVKSPPIVRILNSKKEVEGDSLKIVLKVLPKNGGVGDIRLLLNGTSVVETRASSHRSNGMKAFEKTYEVKLVEGQNEIKAMAFENTNTARSEYAVLNVKSIRKKVYRPKIHALVVGIQEFENSRKNLKYTRADAELFVEALVKGTERLFDKGKVFSFLSKESTSKENILKVLEQFKEVKADDMFVFYAGSHGMVDGDIYYLITSNVGSLSSRRLKLDAISRDELKRAISNIPASKKMIVLDTCFAGKYTERSDGKGYETRGMSEEDALNVLSRAMGTNIFSASKSSQEAVEGYKGHGLFTYVLVQGLKREADENDDGFVKTLELADYIDSEVPKISAEKFKHKQFPTINISGQAFPVSRVEK